MCNCLDELKNKYQKMYERDGKIPLVMFDYFEYGIATIKPFIKRNYRTQGVGLLDKPKDGYAIRPTLEYVSFNYCPICGEERIQ